MTQSSHQEPLEVSTSDHPKLSIIWLHGLGADGYDFLPLVSSFRDPIFSATRFVFPHAPMRRVTINQGALMPAWYDIRRMDLEREVDDASIEESVARLTQLIDREMVRGIEPEKIVLAGFSQGGAVVLDYALQAKIPIAGLVALSTYVPRPQRAITQPLTERSAPKPPIFMAHGTQDGIVPFQLGEQGKNLLLDQGFQVNWKTYRMEHSVHPEEVRDLQSCIATWISAQ